MTTTITSASDIIIELDGSTSFAATGATESISLADRAAFSVNVKDFGAKCDGSWNGVAWSGTDDTAAIQAALDSGAWEINFEGYTTITDTLYIRRPVSLRFPNIENYQREYGDSTGGTQHPPSAGGIFTYGSGTGLQWTDTGVSDATDWTVAIAIMCQGVKFENVTLRPAPGQPAWDSGYHVCGVSNIRWFNCDARLFKHPVYFDATWSSINATTLGFPQSAGLVANLLDRGLTNNKWFGGYISGERTITLQGRKSTIVGTNYWAPNGCSDSGFYGTIIENSGDETRRAASGYLVSLDHQLPGANNNSGQNFRFVGCRFDVAAKDAILLDRINRVTIDASYAETSGTWFTNHAQRGKLVTTANTGEVEIIGDGFFVNITTPAVSDVRPREHIYKPTNGSKISYQGWSDGISFPNIYSDGATGAVPLRLQTPTMAQGVLVGNHANSDTMNLSREYITVALSDETTALATGLKATIRAPYAFTLAEVRTSVATAPTGSTLIVDIKKNGTTIFSTKVSIDASEKTSVTAATPAVLSTTSFASDDEITFHIDQVGSTVTGAGLKATLIAVRTS